MSDKPVISVPTMLELAMGQARALELDIFNEHVKPNTRNTSTFEEWQVWLYDRFFLREVVPPPQFQELVDLYKVIDLLKPR